MSALSVTSEFLIEGIRRGGLTDQEWLDYLEIVRTEFGKISEYMGFTSLCDLKFLEGTTTNEENPDRYHHTLVHDLGMPDDLSREMRERGLFRAIPFLEGAGEGLVARAVKRFPLKYFVWGINPDAYWRLFCVPFTSFVGMNSRIYHEAKGVESFGTVEIKSIMTLTGLRPCDVCDELDHDIATALARKRQSLDQLIKATNMREYESGLRQKAIRPAE